MDSWKTKLGLVLGGTLVGLVTAVIAVKLLSPVQALPEGASFESLEDLRRSMLERSEGESKGGKPATLRTLIEPDPSDLIIYRLKPNLLLPFQGVPVRTNSFGMRDSDVTIEKPVNTTRIALLGDSFAFGWGVEEKDIFANVIENKLTELKEGKTSVEVLNFGVPGYSTFQEVALFEQAGLPFAPDAVLVYFVENDFGLPFFIKNFAAGGEIVSNESFEEMKAEAEDTEIEGKHQQLLKMLDANRSLMKLADICASRNIKLFLVVNPKRSNERLYRRLWVLKQRPNIHVLKIREEVSAAVAASGLSAAELQLAGDPHPSAPKHKILGEVMARALLPHL